MIFTQILSDDDCVSEITVQSSKSPSEDKDKGVKTIIVKGSMAKVKIINPKNSGGSIVKNWSASDTFVSVDNLKSEMGKAFAEYIEGYEFDVGYIEPGHGMKGKLTPLRSDSDLAAMHTDLEFKRKKQILLWIKCLTKPKKRPRPESADGCPRPKRSGSMYESTLQKMHEVDVIARELETKHEGNYTKEQIRCWANMIQMKQHESYDNPPNKPFFKTRAKSSTAAAGISPGKKIGLRTECIQQLDKWHDLMARGIISEEQYKEFKETILADLKKF